jgi:2,3-bisphosphoglycerate-independent phosphoglycerate mutase
MTDSRRTPYVLVILDGWGHREETDYNAIANADTPNWDALWASRPHTLISGSGMDVGLPEGQMGNSEVGHMNLGAGRVVYQDFTRITHAIQTGEFQSNQVFHSAIAKAQGHAIHLLGLVSPGGVHSHEDHIAAMIDLCRSQGANQVYLHAFLDGRDTPPRSALPSLMRLDHQLRASGTGRIASLCGRYYAMDRDKRWDRVSQAYRMLTENATDYQATSAELGLQAAYQRDESDEFVKPTCICSDQEPPVATADGDVVIFMNFRADRARQLTQAFVDAAFTGFERPVRPRIAEFVMLTRYADELSAPCAFPPQSLNQVLGEYLSQQGKTQLRLAETEKYAHVTFFFSGGQEACFPGEERILIPSPKVATYDLQPEMSAPEVTDQLVNAITGGKFDLIVCNYANGDMVGHTGNYEAAMQAVMVLDQCLGRVTAAVDSSGGTLLVTADHGNCEQMLDRSTGQAHTAHTTDLVPLVYVGPKTIELRVSGGTLADVAPTLLELMELPIPPEMTGHSLIVR